MARRKKVNPIPTSDVPLPAPVAFQAVSEGVKMRKGAIGWITSGSPGCDRAMAAIATARQLGHRVYVEIDNGVISFMAD